MLAQVSLPPKAAETGKDKATSALARLPVRESSLALLAGVRRGPSATVCRPAASNSLRHGACLVAGASLVK